MKKSREQWGTKMGFILAAVGSAIGLGNIWRFPYVAYSNGGGAFLIPYFFAIFTAGIPLLILEYGMGHKYRGSTPLTIARSNKKWEWLGWWPIISSSIILCYYSMILSWAIKYLTLSFKKGWGTDTNKYFFNDFLNLSTSPFDFGGIVMPVLISIILVWIINWIICYKGIKYGIEKLNMIVLPTLLIIMIIIVIKGISLEGSSVGLNKLFTPEWSKVKDPKVWIAAYGQVFFSLSIATGIMMTYASYLSEKTDINNSAFITAFANCGFEFLSAIGVFAIIGFMANNQGVSIMSLIGLCISSIFATNAGLYLLDIMDNFINNYGIVVVGLLESILVGWIIKAKTIRNHTNSVSYYKIGKWWDIIIKYITPTILTYMLVNSIITEIRSPYGDYELSSLLTYGWSIILFGITLAIIISKTSWKEDINSEQEEAI